MAKFLAGVGFGQASGSVGGSTYSHNRFGPYIRNRAVPTNPQTASQLQARSRFGNLSQTWRTLTAAQRLAWNTQAPTVILVDALGQQYSPTGQQYFVGLNANRILLGLAQATTPPAQQTAAVITSASFTAVGATGVVTVTFAPAIAASSFYELLGAAPQSAGRTFFGRSQFKHLATLTNTDTSPYVATAAYAAVFGGLAVGDVGKRIALRLRPFSSNGFAGVPFDIVAVVS